VGGLALGTRTTVVRLADGGLWLHSPGPLDEAQRRALEALGPVRALVAPSLLHHLFLRPAAEAFPAARVYVAPGLPEKVRDLRFDEVLDGEAPPAWKGEIDQLPLAGLRRMIEVVFLHRASHSLVATDLAFHVRRSESLFTRVFMLLNGGYGRFGPTRLLRAQVSDRGRLRASLDRLLVWDFDRVIVAHGDVLESGGREALRAGFAWLK
jgi:glyoxylase-like metal-dependent hydrolase (beta-lactamase superfamily II)